MLHTAWPSRRQVGWQCRLTRVGVLPKITLMRSDSDRPVEADALLQSSIAPVTSEAPSVSMGARAARVRRVLVTLTLVLLPVAVLAAAWPLGGVTAVGDDLIYYLPVRQYIGERIRDGELPLWNPLVSMGAPLAADPQSGLWYPFTWLFVFMPPLAAYGLSLGVHFALGGGGMYRFLRSLRHDWRAAFLAAIAFELGGYMVAHRAHLTIHHAVAWMPWIFYFWQRFADGGRYRHFALAASCFGLQLLVQHMQPSLIMGVLLTAYVLYILWPKRRSLWWQYPLGMALGAGIAAVQILPTWFHFSGSGRSTPAYYLFVENSWVPPSALMFLFPMLYGSATPNFLWTERWWGVSHFCEQWCYLSIAILLLAAASSALFRPRSEGRTEAVKTTFSRDLKNRAWFSRVRCRLLSLRGCNREVLFWWAACVIALVIALGSISPLTQLLFHLPIYRSLRVPARWILVWSFAVPILASMVVTVLLGSKPERDRVVRRLIWLGKRALPVAVAVCLALMAFTRWRADWLAGALPRFIAQPVWSGAKAALRPSNPAIWWPLLMMAITIGLLLWWVRSRRHMAFGALFLLCVIDLASLAACIDIDTKTYIRRNLTEAQPLTRAVGDLRPRPGERLLVPRLTASYYHPLEALWPLANVTQGVPTLNGYGPLSAVGQRQLFSFMAWGASERMLGLLRNPDLLRLMGVRFVAARDAEERSLLSWAQSPADQSPVFQRIAGTEVMEPVSWWTGLLWPVRVDTPGIYRLELDADPVPGSTSRWFVRLEAGPYTELAPTHCVEPLDLALGPRRMPFLFVCRKAPGAAFVRIKSELGKALRAGKGTFGRVAPLPDPAGAEPQSPFTWRADVPDGVTLYELEGAHELVWLAREVKVLPGLSAIIDRLLRPQSPIAPGTVLLESNPAVASGFRSSAGFVSYTRAAGHHLKVRTDSQTEQLLVFNESYDQGWKALMDGIAVPVLRANAVCQGVYLPAGRHEVQFLYRPTGLILGSTVSGAAIMALLCGGLWILCRRYLRP